MFYLWRWISGPGPGPRPGTPDGAPRRRLGLEDEALDDRLRLEDPGVHQAQRRLVGARLVVLGLSGHPKGEAEVGAVVDEQLPARHREVLDPRDRATDDPKAGPGALQGSDRGCGHVDPRERGVGDADDLQRSEEH